jgi:3-deoxy-manno-octulosonate cytidylyltransferase (CMP-KDO synthetase)
MDQVIIVIPARYASTRLHAKPLADIHGQPMVQRVYEQAKKARGVHRVIVATDDERIARVVHAFGGEALMTSPDLSSGTDRVAAVADQVPGKIFVNLQGDEPLMDPLAIEKAVEMVQSGMFSMSTVMVPLRTQAELMDQSVVKVIVDRHGRAIYFSRHPIPYSRGPLPEWGSGQGSFCCQRHVGLYVYEREALMRFRSLPVSSLERGEVLEQLRALEDGMVIGVAEADFVSLGVDTPEDLEKVRQFLV